MLAALAGPAEASSPAGTPSAQAAFRWKGAAPQVLGSLLGAETLPSATDTELRMITTPVAVIPSVPPNPLHGRSTVDALLRLLPDAAELPGCPEAPRPEFAPHLTAFLGRRGRFRRTMIAFGVAHREHC